MKNLVCYMLLVACLCSLSGCPCSCSSASAEGTYRGVDRSTGKVRTVVIRKDDGINYIGSVGSYFVSGSWGVTMASNDASWRLCKCDGRIKYDFSAKTNGASNQLEGTAVLVN